MMKSTHGKLSFLLSVALLSLLLGAAFSTVNARQKQPQQEAKQEKKEEQEPEVPELPGMATRVFRLRFANPVMLSARLSTLYRRSAIVIADPEVKTLTVRATPEILASIEEVIKELDSSPPARKNIELTLYLLLATEEPLSGARIPDQLQPVVRQLKNTFAYKGYHLLETIVSRARDGEMVQMSGAFPFRPADSSVATQLKEATGIYSSHSSVNLSADEKGRIVSINNLGLRVEMPRVGASGNQPTMVMTSIDVREGQMAVVGKTSADGSPNALIIVLTAKVLD